MTRNQALQIKDRMRSEAEKAAELITLQLYSDYEDIRDLDEQLQALNPQFVAASMRGDLDAIDQLKEKSLALQKQRAALLQSHGLRPNEDEPAYECQKCKDSGFILLALCDCVKKLMAVDAYTSAGLGKGLSNKTFDTFSLEYYTGEDFEKMHDVLQRCKTYASDFTKSSPSILLIGKTGLGKTHMSAAIASSVAAKGFSVVYESSQKLFDTYEASRFRKSEDDVGRTTDYEECDLLLIDDLGSECATQYTSATFFNLLNLRLLQMKPTIISTNLTSSALEKTYGERIYSRLLGDFTVMKFYGKDIRMQKVVNKK